MATFYKGAAIGTHWHTQDSRKVGFTARASAIPPETETIVNHIATGTPNSPYISLTRSYAVAWHYAVLSSKRYPEPGVPAYVYELEIDDALPHGIKILNPVNEIVHTLPQPLQGIMDLQQMQEHLDGQLPQTPNAPGGFSPNVELQLIALTFAQRDAEVLAHGHIPPYCVKCRFEVELPLSDGQPS